MGTTAGVLLVGAALIGLWLLKGESAPQKQQRARLGLEIGSSAPLFSLQSATQGRTFESASLRGSKNLLIVFFRGSW